MIPMKLIRCFQLDCFLDGVSSDYNVHFVNLQRILVDRREIYVEAAPLPGEILLLFDRKFTGTFVLQFLIVKVTVTFYLHCFYAL